MTEIETAVKPPLLEVRDLSVDYRSRDFEAVTAVRDISFDIAGGEFVGLLGESGCGKSTLGNAILHLLDKPAYHSGGTVIFNGQDIWTLNEKELNEIRWTGISTVFQSSMNSLNPVLRIQAQFEDAMHAHNWDEKRDGSARERIIEVLSSVDLEAERVMRSFPHELSGGMRQRVVLALALLLRPAFVVLDEPTTGLDVVVQRSIIRLLRSLQKQQGFSVLFISHDLGTVLEIADRVMVMYAGELVEVRSSSQLGMEPMHPYSRGLLGAFNDPRSDKVSVDYIPGRPPILSTIPEGCPFVDRCPVAMEKCATVAPELVTLRNDETQGQVRCHHYTNEQGQPIVDATPVDTKFSKVHAWSDGPQSAEVRADEGTPICVVEDLVKTYQRRVKFKKVPVEAVKDASFTLSSGEVLALVGQSGSGKSTIAKILTATEPITSGKVVINGRDLNHLHKSELRKHRTEVQMVFQDPFSSLNPTKTIEYVISRPIHNYTDLSGRKVRERVIELLESVGLAPGEAYLDKLPHQLSGGQRQRVVIARAMAASPKVLIADEPISMLDVSIRAEILELLSGLVREQNVAMLYITHDLLSARLLADRTMVMSKGEIVETGPTKRVVREPDDAYTKLLLDSIATPHRTAVSE